MNTQNNNEHNDQAEKKRVAPRVLAPGSAEHSAAVLLQRSSPRPEGDALARYMDARWGVPDAEWTPKHTVQTEARGRRAEPRAEEVVDLTQDDDDDDHLSTGTADSDAEGGEEDGFRGDCNEPCEACGGPTHAGGVCFACDPEYAHWRATRTL